MMRPPPLRLPLPLHLIETMGCMGVHLVVLRTLVDDAESSQQFNNFDLPPPFPPSPVMLTYAAPLSP